MKKLILSLTILSFYACSGPIQGNFHPVRVRPLTKKQAARLLVGARDHLGEPYKFGGDSPDGWDCSGFASVMFYDYLSYQIPRDTKALFSRSVKIPNSQKRPGDLVFFKIDSKSASHVGIYTGGDRFIHASVSEGIIISSLKDGYYRNSFIGFRRPLLAQAD